LGTSFETQCSKSLEGDLQRQQKESIIDLERLASARKRLQENYQEAQNGWTVFFATLVLSQLLPQIHYPCADRFVFAAFPFTVKRKSNEQFR